MASSSSSVECAGGAWPHFPAVGEVAAVGLGDGCEQGFLFGRPELERLGILGGDHGDVAPSCPHMQFGAAPPSAM